MVALCLSPRASEVRLLKLLDRRLLRQRQQQDLLPPAPAQLELMATFVLYVVTDLWL